MPNCSRCVEALAQAVEVVGVEQRVDLGPRARIGVLVAPVPGPGAQVVVEGGRRRHRRPTTSRQQVAHRLGGGPAGFEHVGVVEVLVAEPGGQVGDERQAEHLGPDVARRDHLVHGAHAHQVGAERLEHADLRRGLVLRSRRRPA